MTPTQREPLTTGVGPSARAKQETRVHTTIGLGPADDSFKQAVRVRVESDAANRHSSA